MPMLNSAQEFETQPCTRCGGSGWHSYCQTWGHTCFQCGVKRGQQGLGRFLTKRGAKAHAHYLSLLPSKRAADLQSGDYIRERGHWVQVLSVGDNTVEHLSGVYRPDGTVDYAGVNIRVRANPMLTLCGVSADTIYVICPNQEQRQSALTQALAFQAILTKTGTVRKRKAVA